MTSSPPSSQLAPAVPAESPALPVGNRGWGLRSLWHLSRHLTARADDNHAAPRHDPLRATRFPRCRRGVRARVRFLAYHRIKPHVPPLVRAPVNSFEFHRCTPQVEHLTLSLSHPCLTPRTGSAHRLLRGLPGYLILFDPHAFVPQRQSRHGTLPPQSAFCAISMHFTATPRIPHASTGLQLASPDGRPGLSPDILPPAWHAACAPFKPNKSG